jgi:predicted ABC-type exoprotein transport system permease subunit
MTQPAFAAAALGWHDFFLAAAGATAALLGLLFVGVSINLAALAAEERVDLRSRAGQAFANLTFVLVIALIMLIPDPDPRLMGISLGLVAALGLFRVGQNVVNVVRGWGRFRNKRTTTRRIAWTGIADLILAYVAWRIWTDADATAIGNLIAVVLVLLIGAADIAWEMLVQVSRERAADR